MAEAYKILGQAAPGATTETDLYAVPASTQAVVSTIAVCNRSGSDATFRIAVSVDGAATANKDYIAYDAPVRANDTVFITVGATLGDTDKVKVYASVADLSFSAFGTEIT